MQLMRRIRRFKVGVSPRLKAAARALGREVGIRPLQPGETRPDDYYVVSHFSGRPIVKDRNATVPKAAEYVEIGRPDRRR
jgi:hypothetical protein